MKKNQFSIVFKGSPDDDEHLRLTDFVQQLNALKNVLRHIDLSITQNKESAYYRIIDLSHSSPANVVIEAVPISTYDNTIDIINKLFEGIKHIKQGKLPDNWSYSLIEAFKKIGNNMRITEMLLHRTKESIEIDKKLSVNIDKILGEDEIIEESITGTLEMLNLHTQKKMFRIYPVIGPKKIDCFFPPSLLQKAIKGVNRYVNVEGYFRYKSNFQFPYSVDVTDIEIYPEEKELPSLSDLLGIAPDATGNMRSEDFIRRMRDNEW